MEEPEDYQDRISKLLGSKTTKLNSRPGFGKPIKVESKFGTCSLCGERVHQSKIIACPMCGEGFCTSCVDEDASVCNACSESEAAIGFDDVDEEDYDDEEDWSC